jgi:hypothetical protein
LTTPAGGPADQHCNKIKALGFPKACTPEKQRRDLGKFNAKTAKFFSKLLDEVKNERNSPRLPPVPFS